MDNIYRLRWNRTLMFQWLNKIRLKGLPSHTSTDVLVVTGDGDIAINTELADMGSGFVLEDGDGTEVTITEGKEVKFIEWNVGININWTDVSTGSDGDPYDLTFYNTLYKQYHGYSSIYIIASDFLSNSTALRYDQGGVIDNTGGVLSAHVLIPAGATATHVAIYGNNADGEVEILEKASTGATETAKGSGNVNDTINITDVTGSGTHLVIKVTPDDADDDRIYGGIVTLS